MTSTTTDRRYGVNGNLAFKAPVRLATTSNITLSGLQSIDGTTTVADDRVLVKNQTTASENGIYVASSGTWTRAIDANGNRDLVEGTSVFVTDGSTLAATYWYITTANTITVGTSSIAWSRALASELSTLSFLQSGTGAVLRGAQDKMRDVVSVKDFGAVGDGSTDDTAAIQAAIDNASDNTTIFLPPGNYKVTSTLSLGERKHLHGSGKYSTLITFTPTANDTCIEIKNASSIVDQGSISDLAIYSSDSTYTKIAIDLIDSNSYTIQRVTIAGGVSVSGVSYWGGSNSIGLMLRGRQTLGVADIDIAADRPIVIGTNPNNSISADHFNLHNLYLIANANPCVEILSGVNLTQVSFTGYQAWVRGTAGLSWVDTTTSTTSYGLYINNVRTEQGTDSAAYSIDIQHNYDLQTLVIDGVLCDSARKGVRLRKVSDVAMRSHRHPGTTEALNVDSTVKRIQIGAGPCFWQAGSTATMTGQRLVLGAPLNPSTAPLPPFAYYDEEANAQRTINIGGPLMEQAFSLANDGTQDIGGTAMQGLLVVLDSEGLSATFVLTGTTHTVVGEVDPVGVFSTTQGTASMTNVYWNAGSSSYRVENKRGVSRNYRIHLIGSYTGF